MARQPSWHILRQGWCAILNVGQRLSQKPRAAHLRKGQWAEDLALAHLRRQGLHFLARNVSGPHGEIDLIFRQDAQLIFVEVRYRQDGQGLASVNRHKQQHILRTAVWYLQKHKLTRMARRFDVVAVSGEEAQATLEWTQDAFRGSGSVG